MKIRNGFVSNSSSSSFIVRVFDTFKFSYYKSKRVLSKEKEKLLIDRGFKRTSLSFPEAVELSSEKDINKEHKSILDKEEYCSLCYKVICNQNDIISFLLKNNIGFEASCHYMHQTLFFKENSKYFIEVENLGLYINTYFKDSTYEEIEEKLNEVIKRGCYNRINVKDFIKEDEELCKIL